VLKARPNRRDVFINVPFDKRGERTFIGLVAGLVALGLNPRSVLEIPAQQSRLDRVLGLISESAFSIHDLSRVGRSRGGGFTVPRFNMPFELGLAVGMSFAHARKVTSAEHQWWVLESVPNRLAVSLSDLGGYDPTIYGGTLTGLFRALTDAFIVEQAPLNSVQDMMRVYRRISRVARTFDRDVFRPAAFRQLVLAARLAVFEINRTRAGR
jgi:hypothetical protein